MPKYAVLRHSEGVHNSLGKRSQAIALYALALPQRHLPEEVTRMSLVMVNAGHGGGRSSLEKGVEDTQTVVGSVRRKDSRLL
jgi:hypothetical protein